MAEIAEGLKKGLAEGRSLDEIKSSLISQGFLSSDVEDKINEVVMLKKDENKKEVSKVIKRFTIKELFDRIGYGFGSPQFVNILFAQTGASYFTIGTINGIRAVLSVLFSTFIEQIYRTRNISKKFIGASGIVFGFSFIFIGMARFFNSVPFFILALFLGTIGVVSYGDLYEKLTSGFKKEKRSYFLKKISQFGLFIIGGGMLLSAFVMDYFPATGTKVAFELFGQAFSFRLYGYLIAFEITAISFILSGYVIYFIKERKKEIIEKKEVVQNSFINLKEHLGIFLSDKILLILLIASTTSGLVQTMGNSFYGIFIYRYLNNQGFGGFMNVAVIFIIALFASIIGPYISRKTSIEYGKFSMLAFGTVLMAIMPLTFYYNPNLVSIAMGTLIGIIGASVTGVAHGLLTLEIIPEKIRQTYFGSFSLLISIPFLITTPIFSYIAHIYGLRNLFLILGVMLLVIVLPLYFLVVIMHRNSKL